MVMSPHGRQKLSDIISMSNLVLPNTRAAVFQSLSMRSHLHAVSPALLVAARAWLGCEGKACT